MTEIRYRDRLGRYARVAPAPGVQLIRVQSLDADNVYHVLPLAFDATGQAVPASTQTLTATNLAEPADADGVLPAGTDALAVDVEGRWVIFVSPPSSGMFPAKVVSADGGAAYTVREQTCTGAGTFADASGAADVTAHNLAELSLGPGGAVDVGTVVQAAVLADNSGTERIVFDHPVYAKYLD